MARNNDINLERRVVRELLRTDNKRGYVQIAVVDWVGEKTYRLVERREFYTQEDGSAKMGKAKGFGRADFALLLGRAREIAELLGLGAVDDRTPPKNASSGVSAPSAPPAGRPDPF